MQNKITLRGYSFQRETEYGGLLVVRRPDGSKVGTTQSEAAARILVRTDERRRTRGN